MADKLRSAGVSIWVDESGIGAATLWSKEIAGAIKGCKVLVLMVTPNSVKSKNVVKEVSLAAEQNKQILPVILEPTEIPEALEYHLAGIQHLDVTGMSASESAEEILPALQRLLGMESEEVNVGGHATRAGRKRSSNVWTAWQLYACTIVAAAVIWFLKPVPSPPPLPVTFNVPVTLKQDAPLYTDWGSSFALSKDGRHLAFTTAGNPNPDGQESTLLHLRSWSEDITKPVQGTEGGRLPFFSSDGQSLGFFTRNELKTVSVLGGNPKVVVSGTGWTSGAAWGEDGFIILTSRHGGLKRVAASGGETIQLTTLEAGELEHRWPQFLPDGRHVLFTVASADRETKPDHIKVLDVQKPESPKSIIPSGSFARYVESGHLIYFNDDGSLHAAPFDTKKLEVAGPAAPLMAVQSSSWNNPQFAVAAKAGILAYLPGTGTRISLGFTLALVLASEGVDINRDSIRYRGKISSAEVSPDDQQVALVEDGDIWIVDLLGRRSPRRLTVDKGVTSAPFWSGEWILFASSQSENPGLWRTRADGTAEPEMILQSEEANMWSISISADGKILVYLRGGTEKTKWGIWTKNMDDAGDHGNPLLDPKFRQEWPRISPDGLSIAYGGGEVYVRRIDGAGIGVPVSSGGGNMPRWSLDGSKLFYYKNRAIWSVDITQKEGGYESSLPKEVVQFPKGAETFKWDVGSDEKRYLFVVDESQSSAEFQTTEDPSTVNIIFNWFTELNEKVPVGKE